MKVVIAIFMAIWWKTGQIWLDNRKVELEMNKTADLFG